MREKGLGLFTDAFIALWQQMALFHSIVDGKVEVADATWRIGNSVLHQQVLVL